MQHNSITATSSMEQHALAILEHNDLWNWPDTKRTQTLGEEAEKFQLVAPKLLYFLIVESQRFGGEVLDYFWRQLETCDKKLKENIASLQQEDFVSARRSFEVLSQGLDHNVNFEPVLCMAAEFFIHLGVAFMSPQGQQSGTSTGSTAFSVGELIDKGVDQLLQQVQEKGGKQEQQLLKALCFKRDGEFCLITGAQFRPFKKLRGLNPVLSRIIPNSIHSKEDTVKCTAMFAGAATAADIINNLNSIGNVMNMEYNVHFSYDCLEWGIEAKEDGGKAKYLVRLIPTPSETDTGSDTHDKGYLDSALKEGNEIQFGEGPDGSKLDKPIPSLCNFWLAVARVLKMSGAADIIIGWKDEADDTGCDSFFIASEDYCQLLDAKLLLSGRAVVA